MGLFKDIYCAACGEKTGLLSRTKLSDGTYVCKKCTKDIPAYIKRCLSDNSLQDYKYLMELIRNNHANYKAFRPSFSYSTISVDTEHDWITIGDSLFKKPLCLPLSHVSEFDLTFEPEELKEGLLGDTVKGNVRLTLRMYQPNFYRQEVEVYGAKGEASKKLLSSTYTYSPPKDMVTFLQRFNDAWGRALDRESARLDAEIAALDRENARIDAEIAALEAEQARYGGNG